MSKRKKVQPEPRDFNVDDYRVPIGTRDSVEAFLWSFKDLKEIGIRIRTPRIWVEGDEIPQTLWYYPVSSDDLVYETAVLNHALSGIAAGWVGITSVMNATMDDDDTLDVQVVFADPDDLLLFKLSMPL